MSKLIAHLFAACLLLVSLPGLAVEIPKALEDWRPWVLDKHPELNCPFLFNNDTRTCSWPSELHIEASSSGATFSQRVEVFNSDWIALPGGAGVWPQNITANTLKIAVRDNNTRPEIYLLPGSYDIKGDIHWSEMPRSLAIAPQTGIVQLSLNGKSVAAPTIDNNGQLWLSPSSETQTSETQQDSLTLRVFRKIEDSVPLRITTQLQLDVSGKERELQLGQLLLKGFTPLELASELAARIEKDGKLRLQVKPGSWQITLVSYSTSPLKELSYTATSELWPQQEVWVFAAQRQLRSVQISGAQTIDPQQTQLPEDWKQLPAYLVTPETHFTLEELQRGETQNSGNNLVLNRSAWLSFDGKKIIQRDQIQGQLQSTRIETILPYELTNAEINGKAQLITHLDNSQNPGIELRQRAINLAGTGQIARSLTLPVSGWNQNFNSISNTLYLPPGWSLLTAAGSTSESNSWIAKWSLWDIFLLLIIVVAIARVLTPTYGALAAATLLVIYQREGAPIFIWLNLIAAIALATYVSGAFKKFMVKYIYLSFIVLTLITLPFAVKEARMMINPTLESEEFFDVTSLWTPSVSYQAKTAAIAYDMSAPAPAPAASEDFAEQESISDNKENQGKLMDDSPFSLQRLPAKPVKTINTDYDINQQTQTGLAVPVWDRNPVNLFWNGPVKIGETTQLFLISPLLNRIGYLLSVLLPLLLAAVLLRHFFSLLDKKMVLPTLDRAAKTTALPALIIMGLWFAPGESARADVVIDQTLLTELETRLTQAPSCLPNCAAIESADINASQEQLLIDMVVHSSDLIALPLPADHQQWWPSQVTVDDKNATLVQSENGLLVSLPKGRHSLKIKANLQGRDTLQLEFPLPLHNVKNTASGWEISGAPSATQASQSLQLQRVERNAAETNTENLRPEPMAAFVILRRELTFDLQWKLTTSVTRVAPALGGINLEIPLLEGESPLTTQVNSNGKVALHLDANEDVFSWSSTLKQQSPLSLQAATNAPWVEVWVVNAAAVVHTETKGIAPIQLAQHENLPIWQPWPGETLEIDITRPQATQGKYLTIDAARLTHEPGNRSTKNTLALDLRSNQGGQYSFTLPKDSTLSEVQLDQTPLAISAVNNVLKIPLHPGRQMIKISWDSAETIGLFSQTPQLNLQQDSSNQNIIIDMPGNRWVLWVGGPAVGPSVLFWGMLLVAMLMALALGRSQLTPLKSYEWLLLSLGICTVNFFAFVLVALWLMALRQRGKLSSISSAFKFKLLQIGLFIFSAIALVVLLGTIPAGLLGSPDMHILGNASNSYWFNWYQDYSAAELPQAWVISLPLWCYKLAILIWALWLASALLNWVRWGWQQFTYRGRWHAPAEIIAPPPAKAESK